MIVDSSAIVAIILGEPEEVALVGLIADDNDRTMSAVSVVEAGMVIEARLGLDGAATLDHWLLASGIRVEPFTTRHAHMARIAWRKYGKGNHPAALNFGNCCVYALAKALNEPILCKGNDFSRTDIPVIQASGSE